MEIKKHIINKTSELFRTYGIKSNTMDDIAREAGTSKRTLYQYIQDKNELIELVIQHEYNNLSETVQNIHSSCVDPIEELIRLNVLIIAFIREINPASVNDLKKHYNSIFTDSFTDYKSLFFEAFKTNIINGKMQNIYRADLNEQLIAQLHSDRLKQMTESKSIWDAKQSTPEIIKELTLYYIRGLVNKEGEILLNKYMNEFNNYLNK